MVDREAVKTQAFIAAAVEDINDDLTVILNAIPLLMAGMDPQDPKRNIALALKLAANKLALTSSALLHYAKEKRA